MKTKLTKLYGALQSLVGKNYDETIKAMISKDGALTILIENINEIKDKDPFHRLEKLVILVGIFQDFGWRFLHKSSLFLKRKSTKKGDMYAKKADCIDALIVLFSVCGHDQYKSQEHRSFIKFSSKDVMYLPEFLHWPQPVGNFPKNKKLATDTLEMLYVSFEESINTLFNTKVKAIKRDYELLRKLYELE